MRPKLRLSRLRDIGWKYWDPIGLLGPDDTWEGKSFADEYDGYLIHAAGQLRSGTPEHVVVVYLCSVVVNRMGMGSSPDMEARAWAVVKAMGEDADLYRPPENATS